MNTVNPLEINETDAPRVRTLVPERFVNMVDTGASQAYSAQTYKQARSKARVSIAQWNRVFGVFEEIALDYEVKR